MNINIDKNEYVEELEKVLKYFYEAKMIGDKEQIKYFQGMSKGILFMLKKLHILNDEEINTIARNIELEIPSIYREEAK